MFPEIAIYSSSDLEYTVEEYEGELSLCSMLLIFVGADTTVHVLRMRALHWSCRRLGNYAVEKSKPTAANH